MAYMVDSGQDVLARAGTLPADYDGEAAQHDHAAVRGDVTYYPGCRKIADEDGKRSQCDHIRRADAGRQVGDASLRQSSRKHSGFARRQDGTADMRHKYREHGADVKVGGAGRGKHAE
jgi:hypothetical protein